MSEGDGGLSYYNNVNTTDMLTVSLHHPILS